MSTTLPNIGVVVPTAGDSDYNTSISTSLTNIDNHDHSSGKGLPVKRLHSDAVDGSTLEVNSNVVRIKDLGVTTGKINTAAVTQAKMEIRASGSTVAAGGLATSTSSGAHSSTSTSVAAITNLSVTITTLGNPVSLRCVPDGTANDSSFQVSDTSGSGDQIGATIHVYRDSSSVSRTFFGAQPTGAAVDPIFNLPPGAIGFIDSVAAGTYTYTIRAACLTGTTLNANYMKLVAYEIK